MPNLAGFVSHQESIEVFLQVRPLDERSNMIKLRKLQGCSGFEQALGVQVTADPSFFDNFPHLLSRTDFPLDPL